MTIGILSFLLIFTSSSTLYYSVKLEDLRRALFNNKEFTMPNGQTYTCPITENKKDIEYFIKSEERFKF